MTSALPVIVIGAGGHAKVLADALSAAGVAILGVTDRQPDRRIGELPNLGGDDAIASYRPEEVRLVNGIGMVGSAQLRKSVYTYWQQRGYAFHTVIHPSAVIGTGVELSEGCQIMAGAIVQPDARIGANSIVNTRVAVDHDCVIGAHVHLAPGVVLSGGVTVGDETHIGTAAAVIQQIHIGSGAMIGAGAVVIRDVAQHTTVYGVPAKVVDR